MPLQDLSDTAHFSPEAPVALPKAAVGERQVVAEPGPTRTSIYHRSQQICEWHKSTRSRPSVSLCERHQRAPKRPHAARSASLEAAYSCSLPLILTKDQVVHIRRTGCRSIRDSRWLLCVCVCVCVSRGIRFLCQKHFTCRSRECRCRQTDAQFCFAADPV